MLCLFSERVFPADEQKPIGKHSTQLEMKVPPHFATPVWIAKQEKLADLLLRVSNRRLPKPQWSFKQLATTA
jgi:hypothetical protein